MPRRFVNPVFLLIRPIPPLAWIPLAILWLGLGDAAKIMVIWFAAFVPSVINSFAGVRTIEPPLVSRPRACSARRGWRFVREVLIPAAIADDLHRLAPVAAGELDHAGRGRARRRALRPRPRPRIVAQQDIYPGMILVGMACVALFGWATTRLLGDVRGARARLDSAWRSRQGDRDRNALPAPNASGLARSASPASSGSGAARLSSASSRASSCRRPSTVVASRSPAPRRRPSPAPPCSSISRSSLMRFPYGFLLAAAVGIPLGLLMGWFRLLDEIVSPVFDGLRFIAPIAWVPFAALWFGTGIGGPILIIFAGAFPPCLINAYRGARFVEPRLIEAAQMLGTSDLRITRRNPAAGLGALDRGRTCVSRPALAGNR